MPDDDRGWYDAASNGDVAAVTDHWVSCQGCAAAGRCQLNLRWQPSGDGLVGNATVPDSWQGAPGVAHGGWIAAVLDEGLGLVVMVHERFAVTRTLTIDFLRPVPMGETLDFVARPESVEEGHWTIKGELSLDGTVLARGRGVWVERDPARHLARYQQAQSPEPFDSATGF